jgi:predicted permease
MNRHDATPNRDAFELPPNKSRIGRAIDDELAFHIEERIRELTASGSDLAEARARALSEFGDVESARHELQRIDELAAKRTWLTESVADLWTDLRRTARALARRPGYAAIATVTLALGIGANSAMFALVDRLLLSPPPHIRDADDVVHLRFDEAQQQSGRIIWVRAPYAYYRALTQTSVRFDVAGSATLTMPLRVGTDTRAATIVAVTPGYFALLGTRPALGRFLVDGDANDERSVVISHALWSRELAGASDVVGRELTLGNETFRVAGVAPRGFTGAGIEPVDAWIPLGTTTPGLVPGWQDAVNDRRLSLIARPHEGVSPGAVAAEATHRYLAARAETPYADSTARVLLRGLAPGRDSDASVTPESRVALWLQAVSVLVLLIAVANVANLLLLRAMDRRRETAVSMALGVSRVRLVRHVMLESLLLGGVAALLAGVIVRWSGPLLWRLLLPDGAVIPTSWRDGAVVAALALGSALAMTMVPALLQLRTPVSDTLRNGTRSVSQRGTRMGDVLVIIQVACAVVLLVGSGLFVRSLVRLADLDLGFEPERVIAVRIDHGQPALDSIAAERVFHDAEARVRAIPGVQNTALSITAPYRPSMGLPVFLPGHEQLPGVGENALGYPSFFAVGPDFFATMGLEMLRGRRFGTLDAPTAPRVMIVDATMARTFWPNGDAIGQCVRLGADTAPCHTVVGVVQDSKRALTAPRHALRYYLPLAQLPTGRTERFLFVRTGRSLESMIPIVRAAVTSGSSIPSLVEVFPMGRLLDPYTKPWRLGRAVFVAFGVLSTIIAAIGLYGVVAFGVARRRRELGIRLALGAPRTSVVRSVMLGAGARTLLGCVVGAAGALLLGRRIQDLLFQTSATDAAVFAAAVVVVILATFVACALPAWRAVRVDPTVSLRAE